MDLTLAHRTFVSQALQYMIVPNALAVKNLASRVLEMSVELCFSSLLWHNHGGVGRMPFLRM